MGLFFDGIHWCVGAASAPFGFFCMAAVLVFRLCTKSVVDVLVGLRKNPRSHIAVYLSYSDTRTRVARRAGVLALNVVLSVALSVLLVMNPSLSYWCLSCSGVRCLSSPSDWGQRRVCFSNA